MGGGGDRLRHRPVGIVDNVLGSLGACPPSPIYSSETFPILNLQSVISEAFQDSFES